jgi:hypothetical protein
MSSRRTAIRTRTSAPALHVADPLIAHLGYLTQEGREEKRTERNLPLLIKDQQVFRDRLLGQGALGARSGDRGGRQPGTPRRQMTPKARSRAITHAVRLFVQHFDDPAHKFTQIARPWYEAALKHLGMGWETEFALAGRVGGLNGTRAKPERVWVRDALEFQRLLDVPRG